MESMKIAIEIMGMGMLGIFTAMLVIMMITTFLKKTDNSRICKKLVNH